MNIFSPTEIDTILMILGYGANLKKVTDSEVAVIRRHLENEFADVLVDRALEILTELVDIDTKLKAATQDSYATEVRNVKLNYAFHINHLKSNATALLEELSNLTDVPLKKNKYFPKSLSSSYISYW
jgi:hypothetical protein